MANIDFVVVPLGRYLENHFKFGKSLQKKPRVFATNYFLKSDGKYTNSKLDKKVWILWAEGRIHGDYDAIRTPIGFIPKHKDLKKLFDLALRKQYTSKEYVQQFSIRVSKYLEKIARMEEAFRNESDIPEEFWNILSTQKNELEELKNRTGKGTISPLDLT